MSWPGPIPETRRETHFGDRVIGCYAERPPHVPALFDAAATVRPEAEALVCGAQRISYAALSGRITAIAGGLAARGIRRGDRVALLMRNSAEFVIGFHAVLKLGAIAVPLNIREQTAELTHILTDCGAKALVVHADLAVRLAPRSALPDLEFIVSVGEAGGAVPFEALNGAAPGVAIGEEDTAAIVYTSGTTGRPKGAMLTHLGLVHAGLNYRCTMGLGPSDRNLLAVPMSHVTGLTGAILAMAAARGTLVVMEEFKAQAFLVLAARERMTVTVLVPAMYKLCLMQEGFDPAALSGWRVGGYGGAIMPPAIIEELAQKLPGLTLMNCYGATETSSPVAMMPPGETARRGASVGCAVPCGEILVMDDAGRALPPGEAGEVWLRAPTTVKGYWNNPDATARELTGGFWHSGDIGRLSADGYLEILDRKKDMINRGGYKIYAAEVEAVLARHEGILESAVIGKPCPVLGERVHAIVVARAPGLDPADLQAFCARLLADFKVPESFTLSADPLPRNANGKVLKRVLRETLL